MIFFVTQTMIKIKNRLIIAHPSGETGGLTSGESQYN